MSGSDMESVSVASSVHSDLSGSSNPVGESEQENAEMYKEGGYHPIKIADVIQDRYHIVRKIGFGHFSTVWLAWDNKSPVHEPEFRALKISKSEKVFAEATKTEIRLLTKIAEADPNHPFKKFVTGILDNFDTISKFGTHICMVTHCHGDNLLHLIQRGHHRGLPEANVKSIIKQVLQGLHYLHAVCGIIHTDIKPENVLVDVSPVRVKKMAMAAVDMHRKGVKFPPHFVASHELLKPHHSDDEEDEDSDREDHRHERAESPDNAKQEKEEPADEDKDTKSEAGVSIKSEAEEEDGANAAAAAAAEQMDGVKTENEVTVKQEPGTGNESEKVTESVWKFPENIIRSILDEDHKEFDPAIEECEVQVKITDFGNSCFVDKHYTYMIQTLPYRSLEVVIQAGYGPSADVWSTACMAFELATGDYLFDGMVGKRFSKTEDHLKHIVEILGNVPMAVLKTGKAYQRYFKYGKLKKYQPRKFTSLTEILTEKYGWPEKRAQDFSDLLMPMLHYDKDQRIAAEPASQHPYLA